MTTPTAETTVQPLSAREKISVAGMFLGVFAVGIDSFVISPLLTPMSKSLAGSVAAVAIGVTTYAVAYAVSAPILAPLGDRYRPANIAIVGITIFAVATLATSFQNSLIGFYTVRAVAGVGGAMYTPNIQAHVSRRYDPIMRGKLIGIIMAGLSASIVLGSKRNVVATSVPVYHCAWRTGCHHSWNDTGGCPNGQEQNTNKSSSKTLLGCISPGVLNIQSTFRFGGNPYLDDRILWNLHIPRNVP